MKKYILAAITVLCAAGVKASVIQPDTIIKVTDVREVVITESPRGVNYIINGTAADSAMSINYTQIYAPDAMVRTRQSRNFHLSDITAATSVGGSRWDIFIGGLGLGMVCAPGAPDEMQFEPAKSFEINWLYALGLRYNIPWNADIRLGMGFVWRNYRSTVAGLRMVSGDMNVRFEPWAEGGTGCNTAIKTFAMQFPLIYTQKTGVNILGNQLSVSAGAVLNVSTYASVKNGWLDTSGQKVRECFHGVGQRKVTVDFIGVVGTHPVSAFVRYSPQSVLTGDVSPRFKSLSAGLMFLF